MSNIAKHTGDNFGGLCKIKWAFATNLVEIIHVYPGANGLSINQSDIDTYFNDIEFMPETANHDEQKSISDQGTSYNQSVECKILKDRVDVREALVPIEGRKVVLLIFDSNSLIKLVGIPEEGLEFIDDLRTGKQIKNTNGYTLSFSGQTTEKSHTVTINL